MNLREDITASRGGWRLFNIIVEDILCSGKETSVALTTALCVVSHDLAVTSDYGDRPGETLTVSLPGLVAQTVFDCITHAQTIGESNEWLDTFEFPPSLQDN